MPRELFVDTNVLLGLTFYSDRWFRAARPAFENDHQIHASDLVVYEYCSSPKPFRNPPKNPDTMDIDWSYNQGLVGRIRSRLSKPYREYRGIIRQLPDEEVTLERGVEEFLQAFKIREQAAPQIRGEFEREFETKAVTRQYMCEFASELIDKILRASVVVKESLSKRVEVHKSEYHTADDDRRKWKRYPDNPLDEPDLSIIIDGTQVIRENGVSTVLSGDKDLLALQEIANEYFGFSILSMADEYSTP